MVGIEGNPTTLDPRLASDAYSTRILPLLFHSLVQVGEGGRITPNLASSWEQPDPLTYVFHLQPGVRFSNGRELNANDVVFTLNSLADPALRSPRKSLADRIQAVSAPDGLTVRLLLKEAYAPLLTDLAFGIVPAEEAGGSGRNFGRQPVGSGPYRLVSWEQGGEIVLEPNPSFAGPPPKIKSLRFRVVPDDVSRVMALERGEINLLLNSVPPDDLSLVEANPSLKVVSQPGINYTYLGFNLDDPILSNPLVRQAIAHAIPREELVRCFFHEQAQLADGLLPPGHWAYEGEVEKYDYNPAQARELLDQAGFLDPEGPDPRFSLVYKTSQNKVRRWMAEAIAHSLEEIGIEVKVQSLEFGTLFADIQSGNFQLYSLTWVGVTEPDIYYSAFHSASRPPRGANRNRYQNPDVDRLTEAARITADPLERAALYCQVQQIIARDLPYVSLFYSTDTVVMDRRLSGFTIYPEGDYRSLAQAYWQEAQ